MFQSIKDGFERNKNYLKNALISAFTAILVVVTVIPLGVQIGIKAEANYFPVVNDFVIDQIKVTREGNTVITGRYHRLRECTLLYTDWVLLTGPERTNIPIPRYSQSVTDTDLGWNRFDNVTLFIRPYDFMRRVTGTAYYRCHPFWITRTTFYDARKQNV